MRLSNSTHYCLAPEVEISKTKGRWSYTLNDLFAIRKSWSFIWLGIATVFASNEFIWAVNDDVALLIRLCRRNPTQQQTSQSLPLYPSREYEKLYILFADQHNCFKLTGTIGVLLGPFSLQPSYHTVQQSVLHSDKLIRSPLAPNAANIAYLSFFLFLIKCAPSPCFPDQGFLIQLSKENPWGCISKLLWEDHSSRWTIVVEGAAEILRPTGLKLTDL